MDASRHTKLEVLDPTARAALLEAAALAQTSVDQVVQAGLGRGNVTEGAHAAAAALVGRFPGLFALLEGWPRVCRFCFTDASVVMSCSFCRSEGCRECVSPSKGCPPCVAAHEKRAAEAAERLRESEAQRAAEAAEVGSDVR